jgi:Suppressor of fused protein (SUFU)
VSIGDDDLHPDARIHRYDAAEPGAFAIGDSDLIDAVSAHIEQHIGPINQVWHEIASEYVHIDVHHVAATPDRPWHVLVTTGMSAKPMTVPTGVPDDFRHAELMISLPMDWDVSEAAFAAEDNYWPVRWLKSLARLPHQYNTWLSDAHTIPNGDPAEPLSTGTRLSGFIVLPSFELDPEQLQLTLQDGRVIRFWSLLPLHADEMTFKLRKGADALIERLDERGVTSVVDSQRPSVAKASWWPF